MRAARPPAPSYRPREIYNETGEFEKMVREDGDGTVKRLTVRVRPGARSDRVQPATDGLFDVWTQAPPSEGRANEAVRRLIADWFRVPPSYVHVVKGRRSRTKVVEVLDS